MNLNEAEVNNILRPFLGRYEDSFQEAWVKILESKPQTLKEVTALAKRVRSREINQYLNKKYREVSLYTPIGKNNDEKFTLESILENPCNEDSEDRDNRDNGLYKKIVDFLIGEYFKQKSENLELKRRDVELKAPLIFFHTFSHTFILHCNLLNSIIFMCQRPSLNGMRRRTRKIKRSMVFLLL